MYQTLTKWQRGIVVAMYAIELIYSSERRVVFTRRALEHALWFDWQGYHTKAMNTLIEWRWIDEQFSPDKMITYTLTPLARAQLNGDFRLVLEHVRVDTRSVKMFADDPSDAPF